MTFPRQQIGVQTPSSGGGAAIGGLVTGGTPNSVLFVGAGGLLAEKNPGLTYDATTNKEVFTVTSGGNSDTATEYAANVLFDGSRGVRIRSTNASAYYPYHLRLENVAYGTYVTVQTANFNGLYLDTQGNARFQFSSTLGGPSSLFRIETANSANSTAVATIQAQFAAQVGQIIKLGATATANALQVTDSSDVVLTAIKAGGGLQPASMADGSAPNSTLYYSTTASKLVFKDAGGVVNALY